MTATIELTSARRKLQSALGVSTRDYFSLMKSWFRKLISKEDFDSEARRLLSSDKIHLHNEFLLAILNKCQTLANFNQNKLLLSDSSHHQQNGRFHSNDSRLKKGKVKRTKPNRFEHRFQTVDISHVLSDADSISEIHEEEKNLRFCDREAILPDTGLVHGRMLVSAWEEGLEGVEDAAVELTLSAVEHQLRTIITQLVMLRNGYKLRDGIPFCAGAIVPDPWLLNSQRRLRPYIGQTSIGEVIEPFEEGEKEDPLVPTSRLLFAQSQQRAMLEVACGSSSLGQRNIRGREPIFLFELLELLKKSKQLIPSHVVHALNTERCIAKLYRKGPNE
uniref:Transcriptional adapter 1-like protein n=1 Tax=Lepeophtheirus salmonis TaxID=72036 RepID=C1BTE9_LEPSM|nr:Transcriptional adapter 1-like protein [Lepeophtheirus salmonis]